LRTEQGKCYPGLDTTLYTSSVLSFSLAHCHTFSKTSKLHINAASCKYSFHYCLWLVTIYLFIFFYVSFSSAHSHIFSKTSNFPYMLPHTNHSFPYCLWLITLYYISRLFLVSLHLTPMLAATYLVSPICCPLPSRHSVMVCG